MPEFLAISLTLPFIIASSTAELFIFKLVEEAIINGNVKDIAKNSGNELYEAAKTINPEVEENLQALKALSPEFCQMTGSGSTCFAMYSEYEMATWAHSKLKKKYGDRVEVIATYDPKELTFFDKLFNFFPPEED